MVNQRDAVLRELRRRVLLAFHKEKIMLAATNSTQIITAPHSGPGQADPEPSQNPTTPA
jgi:hypothetical protein